MSHQTQPASARIRPAQALPPFCKTEIFQPKTRGDDMSDEIDNSAPQTPRRRKLFPNILLLVPFVALLWVPFYNDAKPALFGFPFFYWYQLLWVPLTSLIIFIVYKGNE
jgi:hypothetical protein